MENFWKIETPGWTMDDDVREEMLGQSRQDDIKRRLRHAMQTKEATSMEEKILDIIRSNKVVDHLLEELTTRTKPSTATPVGTALRIEVVGGRAFTDFLECPEGSLQCCVHLEGHRFRTKPTRCACEPKFGDAFYVRLEASELTELLVSSGPIQVNVVRMDVAGRKRLLSSLDFEWRQLLATTDGRASVSLELPAVGPDSNVPVGILDVRLHLSPRPSSPLPKEVVQAQIKAERSKRAESERSFLQVARRWWQEYVDIRPSHATRLVKIFARDVGGGHRMACCFLRPVSTARLLGTAREALRFVSLIPLDVATSIGGGPRTETWKTPATFLDSASGDHESHSIFLCCLHLNLGLNSFVCLGTKLGVEAAYSWVVTLGSDRQVVFWDAVTGNRLDSPGTTEEAHQFHTVDCIFNHRSFYANCQKTNLVSACDFDLSDNRQWKSLPIRCLKASLRSESLALSKWSNSEDLGRSCEGIERQLRDLVNLHRMDLGLSTTWDEDVGLILAAGIAAYEDEKRTGRVADTVDFVEALKHSVPDGHTFKGFPVNTTHHDARRIFGESLQSKVFEDILGCRGDAVTFALHVKVYQFPEDVVSVWSMFAVNYLPVPQ